eukprot:TRINITY_DN82106_c0_g1_i1.p1 TRINITY_DN82106_c0_g1~~TRINITY_DN82106_c0_g1_i1.p1  ORF type:complete len:552 (-),score=115.00 TRINITY_DN82106_c0_g1_i1:150-1805(-)
MEAVDAVILVFLATVVLVVLSCFESANWPFDVRKEQATATAEQLKAAEKAKADAEEIARKARAAADEMKRHAAANAEKAKAADKARANAEKMARKANAEATKQAAAAKKARTFVDLLLSKMERETDTKVSETALVQWQVQKAKAVQVTVEPIVSRCHKLAGEMDKADRCHLERIRGDPVPHVSLEDISTATKFLEETTTNMDKFVRMVDPQALHAIVADESTLGAWQKDARKALMQLNALYADRASKFHGENMKGDVLRIAQYEQPSCVKERLASLNEFFEEFGDSTWMKALVPEGAMEKLDLVRVVLRGLLTPSNHQQQEKDQHLVWRERFQQQLSRACQEQMKSSCIAPGDHAADVWVQFQMLSGALAELSQQLEQDDRRKSQTEARHDAKMRSLDDFAKALDEFVPVWKQCVLIRCGDVDYEQLGVLKAWVTQAEAVEVIDMLNAFCDEVPFARAMRVMQASLPQLEQGSASSSKSMKWELLGRALGNSSSTREEGRRKDTDGDESASECGGVDAAPSMAKKKISHRQRTRKRIFQMKIPKTPSVVSA